MRTLYLDSHKLATWQMGRRRYMIEQKYRYLPWHPTNLLAVCMRRAILQLSSGVDPKQVESQALSLFMAQAKQPGLEARHGTDTYKLSMDLCATMRSILAYLQRITLTTIKEVAPVSIPYAYVPDVDIRWSFLAHADESGLLHRWVFVDTINEDAIFKHLHKWETIADIIVYGAPMMLHFVAIGSTINGRRHSPWCRAYKSPLIAGQLRFAKKKGQLSENWKPVFLGDNSDNDPDQWLDQMIQDSAHEELMLHKTIAEPSKLFVDGFYRDLQYEAKQILDCIEDPVQLPMCRVSCDVPYVCPHQVVCYSTRTTFENSGLYERVKPTVLV